MVLQEHLSISGDWRRAAGIHFKGTEDAKAVVAALKSKGVSAIGAVGFCWGAKVVLELGNHSLINAAVLCHPAWVTVDDIKEVKTHTAILGAETDHLAPPELAKQFEEALSAKAEPLLQMEGLHKDLVRETTDGELAAATNMRVTKVKRNISRSVILVGHDFGGACISYAMEEFPFKVAKAIFISAAMLTSGQSTLDMFSQQPGLNDLMRAAQKLLYANGNDCPPTAIDLDKALLGDLLFNQCPAKDVALASVSMRSIPFAPILEKLSLSNKYSSVRRFYIETPEDNAIPLPLQQSMINANPPERVFRLKGSDHAPFFSKPQALHKLLVEIAKVPLEPVR